MADWINFKELRANLNFADVLRHYEVDIKAKGNQHHGFCPLPNHNGKRNSASFSANLEKGIFHCFGCGAQGNVLEFAALMAGKSPDSGAEIRVVAIELRDKFCPDLGKPTKKREKPPERKPETKPQQPELPVPDESPKSTVVVNAPLDFELKQLDPKHPYLSGRRGLTAETIEHFGLGFCAKGLLAGRIAIPIHNSGGKLIGYCGRIVDDTLIREDTPKYKFPPQRERNGVIYEFHKTELLYNSDWLQSPVDELIVVEGFASVWWLFQMGILNVVALMGWFCSEEQADIILKLVPPSGRIWLISDGDEAGNRCAMNVFERVGIERFIQWIKLEEGKQPTDYPGGWLRKRLGK